MAYLMRRLRTITQWAAISAGTLGLIVLAFDHNPSAAYTTMLLVGLGAAGQAASRPD